MLVSGDADVTLSGDMDGNVDHDGAGTTTVSGSLTGNIDAAAGDVDVTGTVTGNLVSAAGSEINIDGDVVAATVTNAGATAIGGDLTATECHYWDSWISSVTGTVTAESTISLTATGATTGAVTAEDAVTINNDDEAEAENVTFASLYMVDDAQLFLLMVPRPFQEPCTMGRVPTTEGIPLTQTRQPSQQAPLRLAPL